MAAGGADSIIDFVVTVDDPLPAGVTAIDNTAAVADDGTNGTDPTPNDNDDSETTPVTAAPDISVDKSDSVASVVPGGTVVYSMQVTNNGNQESGPVTVTETVPANTTFNAGASTGGWSCLDGDPAATVCTYALGSLLGGFSTGAFDFAVTVVDPVPAGADEISNTASAADDGSQGADSNPANNDDTETTPLDAAPDLGVGKIDDDTAAVPGEIVVYTILYANTGNQNATGVTLSETVPANTSFVPGSSTAGWSCLPNNNAGSTCTFTIGALAAGGGDSVFFAVMVDNPVPAGVTDIDNVVDIADDGANGADPDTSGNQGGENTPITAAPDLSILKDDGDASVPPGGTIEYIVTYSNVGTQGATGVTITDVVPANTTFSAAQSTPGISCAPDTDPGATCTLTVGALAANAGGAATFAFTVDPGTPAGTLITNTANIQDDGANGADPNTADNESTDTTLTLAADLALDKTESVDPATDGTDLTYTVTVTNNGPDDAINVEVSEQMSLPTNVTVQSVNATHGTHGAIGSMTGTWTIGDLADGETATLTIILDVGPFAPHGAVIENSAEITDQYPPDPDTSDNQDTEDTTITAPPCPATPRPGRTPVGQTASPTPSPSPFCLVGVTPTPTGTATPTGTPTSTPVPGTASPTPTPTPSGRPARTAVPPRLAADDRSVAAALDGTDLLRRLAW
jgi:uncharacterized repeat protein (TIGR01451 family)